MLVADIPPESTRSGINIIVYRLGEDVYHDNLAKEINFHGILGDKGESLS